MGEPSPPLLCLLASCYNQPPRMDRRELADKLIKAGSAEERAGLVRGDPDIADEKLAYRLKEICYETWNNEPVKARGAAEAMTALAAWNGSEEIAALESWVHGIAELTKGELEPAVEKLGESVRKFREIEMPLESAQASVASLIPLALLGRYDEAVSTGLDALKIFEKEGDLLAAGKIELNLSNISSRRGDLREAERYGISARNRFITAGESEWQALAENDLAHTYTDLNDFRKADDHFRTALDLARGATMTVTEAEIEASIGNLATFRGRYDEALRHLELSRRKFEDLEMPHQQAIAELEIAEIYLTLNLLEESAEILKKAADALQDQKLRAEEARARADLGRVLLALGSPQEATAEFARAEDLFEQEGNPFSIAAVLLGETGATGDEGRRLELTERALDLAKGNLRLELEASVLRGEALEDLGRREEAETELRNARLHASGAGLPSIALSAVNALGMIRYEADDAAGAEREFRDAVEMVESMRAPIAAEEFRMAYLADKLAPFENLARILIESERLEEAFDTIERARSKTLAESVRRAQEGADKSAEGFEKIAALREELNWFYSKMNRADEHELEDLRQEAAKLENQISETSRREASIVSEMDTESADLSVSKLADDLGDGRALVEYIESDGILSAFVVTSQGISFEEGLATVEELSSALESLRFQFGSMRYGSDKVSKFTSILKSRADDCLRELHTLVFEPLSAAVGDRSLVVVPTGALNYVPFPALFDGEAYEAERREIVSAPAAGVWEALSTRQAHTADSALVVGFADENVPKVNAEAEAVAAIFSEADLITGDDATFAHYLEGAPAHPVIHIACHGRFRSDNPMFSSLHLADGNITVRDICSQRIKAALVTLSACETGLSSIYPGNEIIGLARGFLTAGASNIVLSLWTVNDEATARLMTGMYRGLQRGLSVSASLNAERSKMIEEGIHPYFWAPFVIIGTH